MSFITTIRQSVFDIFRLTYFLKISYIRTRTELPLILNRRGLTGEGVEVGVWKADFSNFLLKHWKGKKLYSVDPWRSFSSDVYIDDMNVGQDEFDRIYHDVQNLLFRFKERSEIIRDISVNAAHSFANETLDFVYLDGSHSYAGVKEDLNAWYWKVKPGGLICGHDYLDQKIGNTQFGVKSAVDEFAGARKLNLLVTIKDLYPSWFIVKPRTDRV